MKIRCIFLTCYVCLLYSCSNESSGFLVSGKINGQNGSFVYLKYYGKLDSTLIWNDAFQFKGKVNIPEQAFIYVNKNSNTPWILGDNFMLENSKISVNLDYSKTAREGEIRENLRVKSVEGSNTQKSFDDFRDKLDIGFYQEENDSLKEKALFNTLEDFLVANPKLEIASKQLELHSRLYGDYLNVEKTELLYSLLDTIYQKEEALNAIKKLINQKKYLAIGSKAPVFSIKSQDGEIFDLEDYSSEFILIDFWASWCVPCRWQNPELVKLYEQYQNKGLEIVSISIDDDLEAWNKAIEKDEMTWINLNDSNQIVRKKYFLHAIPMTILIDKKGEIVGKNLDVFTYEGDTTSFARLLNSMER